MSRQNCHYMLTYRSKGLKVGKLLIYLFVMWRQARLKDVGIMHFILSYKYTNKQESRLK